jgi:adenosylcobinamide-GDP ribazoletransferase
MNRLLPAMTNMNDWLDDLRLAAGMLTRIPMAHPDGATPPYLARAHRVFPLVGAAIGGVIWLVYFMLSAIGVPFIAAAALALGAGMLLTGAFHEDGLADLADGFGGGREKTAKLEIMRDSRIGTYGTLVLLVTFTAKTAALASLPSPSALTALIAVHALSRGPLPAITLFLPYAREGGLAASAGKVEPSVAATAAICALAAAFICLPIFDAMLAAVVTVAAAAAIAALAQRQIGGYTGDVLGGAQQTTETALLVLLAIRHG